MTKYKLNPRQKKVLGWFAVWLASFTAVVVLVPGLLVRSTTPSADPAAVRPASTQPEAGDAPLIPVYLSKSKSTDRIPLETYVRGVVAAEMPAEFEPEALKAQALAARTYIIRRMLAGDRTGVPAGEALVTDTIAHQAYISDEELGQRWGADYARVRDKLNRAVEETKDTILTYEGQPIEASFFSTSNGYTENSEDYWNVKIPYLRSVASPWDAKLSPRYKETVRFSDKELQTRLGLPAAIPATTGASRGLKVLERSQGRRILKLSAGGKQFTGREVREKLGLNSSGFQWSYRDGAWEITTFGYGHGVGMSQWGAQGMALEGRKAEEIVKHYYTGVELSKASTLLSAKSF
ncbi:stage II sporulation protein D [Paenibacillus mucilaginosus]|uniref:Sporulation protein SpoIID n=1 Tax=Paenibacillus mucilaginosus (strain KNP414) TaxID=1036673 RepID=F8FJ10_PAEMK|nr:stage II sporulation protein D [Paenibacillus mucilaginosus]AEI38723.1 Sporulation protein SpoIID [Paenibacillus mucilaginosus KNP414]MCG7215859.1 stage II sporulation protein D [Paenibacillus mucilaginosus]WDM27807.1 stage II sporulation protein D [Paenibacillus mucilaginosus]